MFTQEINIYINSIFSLLVGILLPIGIVHGKSNIRNTRFELLEELDNMFSFTNSPNPIASFELIKYKYSNNHNRKKGDNVDDNNHEKRNSLRSWLAPFYNYKISLVLFSSITSILIFILLYFFNIHIHDIVVNGIVDSRSIDFLSIVTFTFIGGYLWSIQYLLRRIANFDLSPLSFYRSLSRMLQGLAVMAAIYYSAIFTNNLYIKKEYVIAVAFLVGMFPSLFIDLLIAKFPSIRVKIINLHTKELFEELPLDIIIGIDAFMKFRLEEMEINDVQNLATTNPIQLFIETPYGLYQVIDWVAQAQLILAIGTEKSVSLRKVGIRNIFELEKVINNKRLKERLLEVLAKGETIESKKPSTHDAALGAIIPLSPDTADQLETLISIIKEDLHIERLRQIWDILNNQIKGRSYTDKNLK